MTSLQRAARSARIGLVSAAAVVAMAGPAAAYDWPEYIQCEGSSINLNEGDLTAASVGSYLADPTHPDWGGAEGYGEAVQVPMTQSGGSPAPRQRGPLKIVKPRSKSSPLYMKALVDHTQLDCTIEFWDTSANPVVKIYTITLVNARVSLIELQGVGGDVQETIEFYAQEITWTHDPTSVSYTDYVNAPP